MGPLEGLGLLAARGLVPLEGLGPLEGPSPLQAGKPGPLEGLRPLEGLGALDGLGPLERLGALVARVLGPLEAVEPLEGFGPLEAGGLGPLEAGGLGPLEGLEPLEGPGPLEVLGPLERLGPLEAESLGPLEGLGPPDVVEPLEALGPLQGLGPLEAMELGRLGALFVSTASNCLHKTKPSFEAELQTFFFGRLDLCLDYKFRLCLFALHFLRKKNGTESTRFFLFKKKHFFLRKSSPNIKQQTKVFSSATNLNIAQAKNNTGSRLELCSWPPAVLKSNIRLPPNSTLVNIYSGRRLCLPYMRVANSAPFTGEAM